MSTASPVRPLPTVIGPTENALRALLLRVLEATPLSSYEQWVVLNLVERRPDNDDVLIRAVIDGLALDDEAARSVLRALQASDLLHRADDAWQVSSAGLDLLTRERERVAAITAHLLDGIAEADIATAVGVLDQVRARARQQCALLR